MRQAQCPSQDEDGPHAEMEEIHVAVCRSTLPPDCCRRYTAGTSPPSRPRDPRRDRSPQEPAACRGKASQSPTGEWTAEISSASLHPKNLLCLTVEGIRRVQLRTGITPAKVGDAEIGAKQIRPVSQQFRVIQLRRDGLIPAILEETQSRLFCHVAPSYLEIFAVSSFHGKDQYGNDFSLEIETRH